MKINHIMRRNKKPSYWDGLKNRTIILLMKTLAKHDNLSRLLFPC